MLGIFFVIARSIATWQSIYLNAFLYVDCHASLAMTPAVPEPVEGLFTTLVTNAPKVRLNLRKREPLWHKACVAVLGWNFVVIKENIKNLAAFCALKMVVITHFSIKTKLVVFYFN